MAGGRASPPARRRFGRARRAAYPRRPVQRPEPPVSIDKTHPVAVADLVAMLRDAHARTRALLAGLDGDLPAGPEPGIVTPLRWGIGHVAWFHEFFVLRRLDGRAPLIEGADSLYDSIAVPQKARWRVPLPDLAGAIGYAEQVLDALIARLRGKTASVRDSYFTQLTLFHEDMHDETFTYNRQTLGYAAPPIGGGPPAPDGGPLPGDAELPGGTHALGADGRQPFVFDNEKWSHPVAVAPFRIARAPVTNAEFACFVDDGGYRRRRFWDDEGWAWREAVGARAPVYWRRDGGGWRARRFDRAEPLAPHRPVVHVGWHEANAFCRWAGRRLPTEVEWEVAASRAPSPHGGLADDKRRFPWGNAPPDAGRANLDGAALGVADVGSHAAGDSGFGCRQMIGNVWEWTDSAFAPYPGFAPDPYRDYSAPWFRGHRVLRGGSWATRRRLIWNTWRNFVPPHRRDLFTGFRTCAV